MSDLEMWSALVGFGLPMLIAIVNRPTWPAWGKGLVAVVTSVVAGGVTAWLRGELSGGTVVHAALVVAVAAIGSYHLWWHPTGIAPAVERVTSPR